LFCPLQEELRVLPADRLRLAALPEPLQAILSDRLQHREPRLLPRSGFPPEQMPVHERRDALQNVGCPLFGTETDRFCRLEGRAAWEDREPPEKLPLRG